MTQFDFFEPTPAPVEHGEDGPDLGLRVYQSAAREAVAREHKSVRSTLVVLPTGTGKSRLAGSVVWDHKRAGSKALILCPTVVLCQQMFTDMRALGLRPAIEQAENKADRSADVVVASVATMRGRRLESWNDEAFGIVIADECHRSTSDMYGDIFAHFSTAKLLGLTATPDRADGVSLGNVFETVAYEMSMLQAIRDGWLVRLEFKTARTNFDPKRLKTIAGEVDAGSVERELLRAGVLHDAANTLAELADGSRTVAFLPTVAASKAFMVELSARGVRAAHIDGTTPQTIRDQTFRAFVDGHISVLSNVAVLTEGWDCPVASVIALLSPTKSRARLAQCIGRGTRRAPGKDSALIIDFVPGRMKRGRLAAPADALAGKMLDDDVAEHLPTEGDLEQAIMQAERTAEDIARRKVEAEERARVKAERLQSLRQHVTPREVDYTTEAHDAGALLGGHGPDNDNGARVQRTIRPQMDDEQRRRAGLCSEKQGNVLKRYGLNPHMKRNLAREAMDAISENKWKLPDAIKNDPRFYAKKDAPQASAA